MNLSDPQWYQNRDLSWLQFNQRVLEEALDRTNPLLERLKFLAIVFSNLDEFFMIRVAGIKEQIEVGFHGADPAGMTPVQQMERIAQEAHRMTKVGYSCFQRSILPALRKEGCVISDIAEVPEKAVQFLDRTYEETVFPVLTPMAVDPSRPFPNLQNRSLNLIVSLKEESKSMRYAVVPVPSVLPRLISVPNNTCKQWVFLEQIIIRNIHKLFPGYEILRCDPFRITRNADLDIDEEEADDLLAEIQRSLKRRHWGFPVRLEVRNGISQSALSFLCQSCPLEEEDIYPVNGPLDLATFLKSPIKKGFESLFYPSALPQSSPRFRDYDSAFEAIRKQDILLHHPFESFQHVIDLLREASEDPNVLAIKQTLYRVGGDSPIIRALIRAAENGKQVTALVELKARFDEENNILWARRLEDAGCHVVYGLMGLKTHCKTLLVIRREEDGIRRYVHMSTGNYNDTTAALYTDMGYLTTREPFGYDASSLFNVLTGYAQPPAWKTIAFSPINLRQSFIEWIQQEIRYAERSMEARIIAKMNSLVDPEMIRALYQASIAGVEIDLIVRGICCLKPGIPGLSERIRVRSVVGRYLEHTRVFSFHNGGDTRVLLSSADWMPRNLDRRVEILFPIEEQSLKERVGAILDLYMRDTIKAREMQSDGTYTRVDRRGKPRVNAQMELYQWAVQSAQPKKTQDTRLFKVYSRPDELDEDDFE